MTYSWQCCAPRWRTPAKDRGATASLTQVRCASHRSQSTRTKTRQAVRHVESRPVFDIHEEASFVKPIAGRPRDLQTSIRHLRPQRTAMLCNSAAPIHSYGVQAPCQKSGCSNESRYRSHIALISSPGFFQVAQSYYAATTCSSQGRLSRSMAYITRTK